MTSLNELRSTKKLIVRENEQIQAFEPTKDIFVNNVLRIPNLNERFKVNLDDSGKGDTGCISQYDQNGDLMPIAFSLKQLSETDNIDLSTRLSLSLVKRYLDLDISHLWNLMF